MDFERDSSDKEDYVYRGREGKEEFEVQNVGTRRHLIIRAESGEISKTIVQKKLGNINNWIELKGKAAKL